MADMVLRYLFFFEEAKQFGDPETVAMAIGLYKQKKIKKYGFSPAKFIIFRCRAFVDRVFPQGWLRAMLSGLLLSVWI